MKSSEVAPLRLHNQGLAAGRFKNPADVVRWFGAVQAQDYLGSLWALGLRLPGVSEAAVEQAVTDRAIVRTWPLRGTLHFVAAEDVRWMLGLSGARTVARAAGRYRQLGLDEATFAKSLKVIGRALEGCEIAVVDERLAKHDPGKAGELVVRGPQLSPGWRNVRPPSSIR